MKPFIDPDTQQEVDPNQVKFSSFIDPDNISPQEQISTTESAISGFNRPFEQLAEGGLQLGAKTVGAAAEFLGFEDPTKNFQQSLSEVRQEREQKLTQAEEQHPVAAYGGQAAGILGSAATLGAIPGGTSGGLLRRIATGATAGAGFGGAAYVEEDGSRLQNIAAGATLGGILPGLIHGASKTYQALKNKTFPGITKVGSLAEEAAQVGTTKPTQEAAERLGTFVTPGEASGVASIQKAESRLKFDKVYSSKMQDLLQARNSGLQEKLDDVIASMAPEGKEKLQKQVADAYLNLSTKIVPDSVFNELHDNPILFDAIKKVGKDINYRPDLTDSKSFGRLDAVKQYLDDKIASVEVGSKAKNNLKAAKNELLDKLDNISPEYSIAREQSQRLILQRSLEDKLAKAKLGVGEEKPSVSTITNLLFGTDAKIATVRKAVETAGGNVQQLNDVIKISRAIQNSTFAKGVQNIAAGESRLGGYISKGVGATAGGVVGGPTGAVLGLVGGDSLANFIGSIPSKSLGKAYVRLATDPNYAGEVAAMAAAKGAQKAHYITAGLSKVLAAEGLDTGSSDRALRESQPGLPETPGKLQEALASSPLLQKQSMIEPSKMATVIQEAPKDQADALFTLSQMPADEYYKYLDTSEKRAKYFDYIKKYNGDTVSAGQKLRTLANIEKQLKEEVKNNPVDNEKSRKRRELLVTLISTLVATLFGGAAAAIANLKQLQPAIEMREKALKSGKAQHEKIMEKLKKEQDKAVSDLIALHSKTLTPKPEKEESSYEEDSPQPPPS